MYCNGFGLLCLPFTVANLSQSIVIVKKKSLSFVIFGGMNNKQPK